MKRESGYYWVKDRDGDWIIAYFYGSTKEWQIIGIDSEFKDSEFDEINETKIERK